MPIITRDRPDPNFYNSIIAYDDGSWAAEPIPVEDTMVYRAMGGYAGSQVPGASGTPGYLQPGLRTIVSRKVQSFALDLINKYAPPDMQRNALYTLTSQPTGSTAYINAKATIDWVTSVNTYRDQQIANIHTLDFNQIVAYVMPTAIPPWPAPPSFLTPIPPVRAGTQAHKLRFG